MIYGLMYNTPDYTNTTFSTDLEKITKLFLEELIDIKNNDDEYCTAMSLIEIDDTINSGTLEISRSIFGSGCVKILRNWSLDEEDE